MPFYMCFDWFKKVEVICQCTEFKNTCRSQGVPCRCHRVIFFKWSAFGLI